MKAVMFLLGAFMVTCAAIGWCCVRISDAEDEDV